MARATPLKSRALRPERTEAVWSSAVNALHRRSQRRPGPSPETLRPSPEKRSRRAVRAPAKHALVSGRHSGRTRRRCSVRIVRSGGFFVLEEPSPGADWEILRLGSRFWRIPPASSPAARCLDARRVAAVCQDVLSGVDEDAVWSRVYLARVRGSRALGSGTCMPSSVVEPLRPSSEDALIQKETHIGCLGGAKQSTQPSAVMAWGLVSLQ